MSSEPESMSMMSARTESAEFGAAAAPADTGRLDVIRSVVVGYLIYSAIMDWLTRIANVIENLAWPDVWQLSEPRRSLVISAEQLESAGIALLAAWVGGWVLRRALADRTRLPRAARAYAATLAVMVSLHMAVWWLQVSTLWRLDLVPYPGTRDMPLVGTVAAIIVAGHLMRIAASVWMGRASALGWPRRRDAA